MINPYDPCTANKQIAGNQMTVVWHVDDLKINHKDLKQVDKFIDWLDSKYGDPEIGKITAVWGKKHDYLSMVLDHSKPGSLRIDMTKCVASTLEEFLEKLDKEAPTPATEKSFSVHDSPKLKKK